MRSFLNDGISVKAVMVKNMERLKRFASNVNQISALPAFLFFVRSSDEGSTA